MAKVYLAGGLAVALAGLVITFAMLALLYSPSAVAEEWQFRLGLAGSAALSALGQVLILSGGASVWHGLMRSKFERRRKARGR